MFFLIVFVSKHGSYMKRGCLLELRKTLRYSAFSLRVISALLIGPASGSLPSRKREGRMRKQFQCHMVDTKLKECIGDDKEERIGGVWFNEEVHGSLLRSNSWVLMCKWDWIEKEEGKGNSTEKGKRSRGSEACNSLASLGKWRADWRF